VHLERAISGSAAVRRELAGFELGQIWITDQQNEELADAQKERMREQFGTVAIPLHAIVDPETGGELARFKYRSPFSESDYEAFLRKGLEAYRTAHPKPAPSAD